MRIKTLLNWWILFRRSDGAPPQPGEEDVDLRWLQSQETGRHLQSGQGDGGAESQDPADGEDIEVGRDC